MNVQLPVLDAYRETSLPGVELTHQTSHNGRAAKTLKVARCLGAGLVLLVVAHQAVAQDAEPTVFWKRIKEKGAGINYLLFGDRLKLMTGAEYSVMHDSAHDGGEFDGWTYLVGARVHF